MFNFEKPRLLMPTKSVPLNFVVPCVNSILILDLHSSSLFFFLGGGGLIFERCNCSLVKTSVVGGSHQTGLYKHTKNNSPERISFPSCLAHNGGCTQNHNKQSQCIEL